MLTSIGLGRHHLLQICSCKGGLILTCMSFRTSSVNFLGLPDPFTQGGTEFFSLPTVLANLQSITSNHSPGVGWFHSCWYFPGSVFPFLPPNTPTKPNSSVGSKWLQNSWLSDATYFSFLACSCIKHTGEIKRETNTIFRSCAIEILKTAKNFDEGLLFCVCCILTVHYSTTNKAIVSPWADKFVKQPLVTNEVGLPYYILLFWVHFHNDFTSLNIKGVYIHDKVTDEVSTVRNMEHINQENDKWYKILFQMGPFL